MRRYETVLCKLHNTSGIEIFSKAQEAANIEILGPWCYTRGSRAVSIFSGELSIPGGVARGSIPGRLAASTQSGVPSVPGKIQYIIKYLIINTQFDSFQDGAST